MSFLLRFRNLSVPLFLAATVLASAAVVQRLGRAHASESEEEKEIGPEVSTDPLQTAAPAPASGRAAANPFENLELAFHRAELIDFAFRAACEIPAFPHIKSRCEAQEKVAALCLELEQPATALAYLEKIQNWRRGVAHADLARHLVRRGHADAAQAHLEKARLLAVELQKTEELEEAEDVVLLEGYQAWRRDRIRARIARVYHELGQPERALEFEEGLEVSELGVVEAARAETLPAERVGPFALEIERIAGERELDRIGNALDAGEVLLRRFHGDPALRTLLVEKLLVAIDKAPLLYRAQRLLALGEVALSLGDRTLALDLAERVEQVLASRLAVEDDLPVRARLCRLRHRAGDTGARQELEEVLASFDAARDSISNLNRADVLVPIAEALVAMEDVPAALAIYRRAAVDGAENPNALPRAEDFVLLCCSLARHDVQPDAELWTLIRTTFASLGEPW